MPLREDWAAFPRTARTAATVAAPATIPPAAAIAAVRTSPRQTSTWVEDARSGRGRGASMGSCSSAAATGSSTACASKTDSSRLPATVAESIGARANLRGGICALCGVTRLAGRAGGAAQRQLIDPVALGDLSPHPLHGPVHRLVYLEDPARVTALLGHPCRRLPMLDVQGRCHAHVLVLRLHAERKHANAVDLPPAREEVPPTERKEPTSHPRKHLVDVGKRECRADHLALPLGDHAPLLGEHGAEVLRLRFDLRLGDRDESPVRPPGLVVDLHERPHLCVQVPLSHLANHHPMLGARLLGGLLDELVELIALLERVQPQIPHEEVHRLVKAVRLQVLGVVRRVPGLEDQRWLVEAVDQEPALIVGGEVHRAEHAAPSPLPKPCRGRVHECADHLGIVLGLEETEHPVVSPLELIPTRIDLRRDPPDHLAVALGEEVLGLRVLEIRILALVEEVAALKAQRRNPLGIVAAQAIGQLDEAPQVAAPSDWANGDGHGRNLHLRQCRRPSARPSTSSRRRAPTTASSSSRPPGRATSSPTSASSSPRPVPRWRSRGRPRSCSVPTTTWGSRETSA